MPTLTERKRLRHPVRYARKDARTRIYRVLYGEPERHDNGSPSTNDTRKLPQGWSFAHAERVWKDWHEIAEFPPVTFAALERRLHTLRNYRPKTKEQAEITEQVNRIAASL